MGFFNVTELVEANKKGELKKSLWDYDINDLVLIKHEIDGIIANIAKHPNLEDLRSLFSALEAVIQEKKRAKK